MLAITGLYGLHMSKLKVKKHKQKWKPNNWNVWQVQQINYKKKNADFARRGKACATGEQGW